MKQWEIVKPFVTENDTKLKTNIKNQGFHSLGKGGVGSSILLGGTNTIISSII